MKKVNFSLVQMHLNNEGFAKREVVKNNTVIGIYKNRYYHIDSESGVRYPYVPTNADLQAKDWELVFVLGDETQKLALNNSLNELKSIIGEEVFTNQGEEAKTLHDMDKICQLHLKPESYNEWEGLITEEIEMQKAS